MDDLVTRAIVEVVARSTGKAVSAPIDALAEAVKDRWRARLYRTREAADAKADGRPLEMGDRVLAKALSEAAVSDDPILADYLGGVLAASSADDDTGSAVVAQIARLSALQLRVHYIIYREVRRLWPIPSLNLYEMHLAHEAGVRIPLGEMVNAAGGHDSDAVGSAVAAIWREGLIQDEWAFSPETADDPHSHSLRVRPTGHGAELFLWGHGTPPVRAHRLLDPRTPLVFLTEVPETPNATLLTPP